MKKCPFCSAEILDDAEFCLYCMRQLDEKNAVKSNHRQKSYWWIVLVSVLAALIVCAAIILTVTLGANIVKTDISSSTSFSSTYNEIVEDENEGGNYNNISDDKEQNDNKDGEEDNTEVNNSGIEDTLDTPDSPKEETPVTSSASNDDTDKSNDNTPEISQNGNSDAENGNSSTETPPPTPPQDPQPEETKQTWSVKEVVGGVEITGIENYNTSGSYEIPSQIDGKTVVGIGLQAFYYEQDLKSITLPDTLKYIDEQAFANCNSLTEIIIPANVTEIKSNAFMSCSQLARVYIKSTKVAIANYAFSNSYQRNVTLTIYAPSSVMNKIGALAYDAEYVEWNG